MEFKKYSSNLKPNKIVNRTIIEFFNKRQTLEQVKNKLVRMTMNECH